MAILFHVCNNMPFSRLSNLDKQECLLFSPFAGTNFVVLPVLEAASYLDSKLSKGRYRPLYKEGLCHSRHHAIRSCNKVIKPVRIGMDTVQLQPANVG